MVSKDLLLAAGAVVAAESVGITNFSGGVSGQSDDEKASGGGPINISLPEGVLGGGRSPTIIRGGGTTPALVNAVGSLSGRVSGLESAVSVRSPDVDTSAFDPVISRYDSLLEDARDRARDAERRANEAQRAADIFTAIPGAQSNLLNAINETGGGGDITSGVDVSDTTRSLLDSIGGTGSVDRETGRDTPLRLQDYATPEDGSFGVGDAIAVSGEVGASGGDLVRGSRSVLGEVGRFTRENRLFVGGVAAGVAAAPFTGGLSIPAAIAAAGGGAEVGSDVIREQEGPVIPRIVSPVMSPAEAARRNASPGSGGGRSLLDRSADVIEETTFGANLVRPGSGGDRSQPDRSERSPGGSQPDAATSPPSDSSSVPGGARGDRSSAEREAQRLRLSDTSARVPGLSVVAR